MQLKKIILLILLTTSVYSLQSNSSLLTLDTTEDVMCSDVCYSLINITMLRRPTQTDINNLNIELEFTDKKNHYKQGANTLSGTYSGRNFTIYRYLGETCTNYTGYYTVYNVSEERNYTTCEYEKASVDINYIRQNLRNEGDKVELLLEGTKNHKETIKWGIKVEEAYIDPLWISDMIFCLDTSADSGATLYDYAGNNHNATNGNGTWITNNLPINTNFSSVIRFNKTTAQGIRLDINLSGNTTINPNAVARTIVWYGFINSSPAQYQDLWHKANAFDGSAPGFQIWTETTGLTFHDGTGYTNTTVDVSNRWIMITTTMNTTSSRVYIDGNTTPYIVDTTGTSQNPQYYFVAMSNGQDVSSGRLKGDFAMVAEYNKVLTTTEIQEIYNSGNVTSCTGYVNFTLTIINPNSLQVKNVSGGEKLTINYTYSRFGVNITSSDNMNITGVSIDGYNCAVNSTNSTCTGTTPVCSSLAGSTCTDWNCTLVSASVGLTGYIDPTANSVLATGWTNPGYAYTSNNTRAGPAAVGISSNYSGFTTGIPSTATINGLYVRIEALASSNTGTNAITVRVNNGSSWSGSRDTPDIQTSESTNVLGGATDTWGLTWYASNANRIQVNVTSNATSTRTLSLDNVDIQFNYTNASSCSGTAYSCEYHNNSQSICSSGGCSFTAYKQEKSCNSSSGMCEVNCTTPVGLSGLKSLYMNLTYITDSSTSSDSEFDCIYYSSSSLCTGASDCTITCPQTVSSSENVGGYQLTFSGSGEATINAAITGVRTLTVKNGCFIKINRGSGGYITR